MVVNTGKDKSAIMPQGTNVIRSPMFRAHGKRLHVTGKFKYIGFLMASNGSWCRHVSKKILKVQGRLMANARFWTERNISQDTTRGRTGRRTGLDRITAKVWRKCDLYEQYLAPKAESIQTKMQHASPSKGRRDEAHAGHAIHPG
jgi:hypothetical protein